MRKALVWCVLVASMLFVAGLSAAGEPAKVDVRQDTVWYRLHFGLGHGDNALSFDDARQFVDQAVTPRFPSGLTMQESRGQWKDPDTGAITRENTLVVDIDAVDTPGGYESVSAVAKEYVAKYKSRGCSAYLRAVRGVQAELYY